MTDKTKLQTFQQVIGQQNIKDIFNQSNITLKNKKGVFKERHGGLTVKFDNDVNNINERINDILNNFDADESLPTQPLIKEVATQTKINKEKNTDKFTEYSYNSVTVLENKKLKELRKKIFLLKKDLKSNKEKEKYLMRKSMENIDKYKLKDEELYKLENELIDIETEKNNQNSNLDYWNKLYFHKEKIVDKKNEISEIYEKNKDLQKEIKSITFKIYELESNIFQLTEKIK